MWIYHTCPLLHCGRFLLCLLSGEFFFYQKWELNCARSFFYIYWDDHIFFLIEFFCLFLFIFLLEGNCFTILSWFLPYINMNHMYAYVPSLLKPLASSSPSYPEVVTEHWFELPGSLSKFPHVYVSMPFSQFILLSPSPTVFTSLFSISVSLLLPCK